MRIRAVDASRPDSCHDAFVWNLSNADAFYLKKYSNGDRDYWLLADSAYALHQYVLVPCKSAISGSMEHKFNLGHSSAWNIVERTISNLKNRLRLLNNAINLLILLCFIIFYQFAAIYSCDWKSQIFSDLLSPKHPLGVFKMKTQNLGDLCFLEHARNGS